MKNILNILNYSILFLIIIDYFDFLDNNTLYSIARFCIFIILYFTLLSKNYFTYNKLFIVTSIFFIYIFFVTIFFSDISALKSYFSLLFGTLILIPSYKIGTFTNNIYYHFNIVPKILTIFLIFILLSNLFNFGTKVYFEDNSILSGGLSASRLYVISIALICSLIFIEIKINRFYRIYILILNIVTLLILIFLMRRSSIIVVFISYILYIIYNKKNWKIKKYIILIFAIISFLIYYQWENISYRLEVRKVNERGITEESRTHEIIAVFSKAISFESIQKSLFGSNIFNSYGDYNYKEYKFKPTRMLHSDISVIIHGSGLIGFILYIIFYFTLFKKIYRLKLYNHSNYKNIYLILLNLFLLSILLSYTGRFTSPTYRFLNFYFIGLTLGYLEKNKFNDY